MLAEILTTSWLISFTLWSNNLYLFSNKFYFIWLISFTPTVKSNKSFQKNIDININNYKHFNAKYIIYESNGISKEYYGENDVLSFEGEYLNGKRNRKEKEYNCNVKLRFESEYLNDIEWI